MQTRSDLYQKISPLLQLGIWEYNPNTGAIFWNEVMRAVFEVEDSYQPSVGKDLQYYVEPEVVRNIVNTAMLTGDLQTVVLKINTAKNNIKWIKTRLKADYQDNHCERLYGTVEDITAEVNLMKTLKEREERFSKAFDYAPIGMAIVSPTGQWIKVNNSLRNLLGYDEDEFLKNTFQDYTYPDDLSVDLKQMHELLAGEIGSYAMEKRYFHRDGHLIWALLSVSLVRNDDGEPLYFISQIKDITEFKQHTELLLRERQRLNNIIKSTRVGTWEWHIADDALAVNKRVGDILGYVPDDSFELNGMSSLHELIHPADREYNDRQFNLCLQQKTKYYATECRMRHRQGNWVWVDFRGAVVERAEDASPLLMLGTLTDIHERKSLEEESQETLKLVSEQNDRLLNFAHIVSHNLRSHAGNIQMLLDMLVVEEDEAEKKTLMEMLTVNANNLQDTLLHLNDVVQLQTASQRPKAEVNLSEKVLKTLNILSESLRNTGARVEVDIADHIIIKYEPAYLESILLNLVSNCIKYRNVQRRLEIRIAAQKLAKGTLLIIADNGIGIDLKMHGHKLFGMYKTFHGNEDARGVGLFLVKNHVEAMGGRITTESEPGIGTTFKIEIV